FEMQGNAPEQTYQMKVIERAHETCLGQKLVDFFFRQSDMWDVRQRDIGVVDPPVHGSPYGSEGTVGGRVLQGAESLIIGSYPGSEKRMGQYRQLEKLLFELHRCFQRRINAQYKTVDLGFVIPVVFRSQG